MGKIQKEMIKKLLDDNLVEYKIFNHDPVYTSKQAAKVRGVELKTGVKALVFKTNDGKFMMGLVAADRRVDTDKLAEKIEAETLVLATPEEVLQATGCEIGSVHPFGNLMKLPTYMDESVLENEQVNFNIGMHNFSVQMSPKDLVNIVRPTICDISKTC